MILPNKMVRRVEEGEEESDIDYRQTLQVSSDGWLCTIDTKFSCSAYKNISPPSGLGLGISLLAICIYVSVSLSYNELSHHNYMKY